MAALPPQAPTGPIEPTSPLLASARTKALDRNRAVSSGPRNTSSVEVRVGRPAGWMKALTGRSAMKSPGAPSLRRDVERAFWREIATGLTSEEAAVAVGASQAASSRWFRERGGMPSLSLTPLSFLKERGGVNPIGLSGLTFVRPSPPGCRAR